MRIALRPARWFTVPAGLLVALVSLIVSAPPAAAHAELLGTDPQRDAVLATAPKTLTLTFNEPITVWPTSVSVFDPAGKRVQLTVRGVDDKVVATLPGQLAQGTYTVSWRVISADDHPVSGGFPFSIGKRTAPTGQTQLDEPSTALNLTRLIATGLGYLGVLGGIGLAVFELLVLAASPGAVPRVRRRLRITARVLTGIGVVGVLAGVPLTTAWQQAGGLDSLTDGAIWSEALSSDTMTSALLAVAGLLVVAIGTAQAAARGRRPVLVGTILAGAAVALISLPWVGHTRTYGPGWLVVAADLVHVAAGSVWLGGIIGLTLALTRRTDLAPERAARTVAGFSTAAAWLVLAVAVAGTTMAWRILGSVSGLWQTPYGKALLVKLGVVAVILAVAAWNRYRLLPAIAAQPRHGQALGRLRTTVRAEAAGLVAVLAVTGVLVTQAPQETAAAASTTPRARGIETSLGNDLVRLRTSPLTTGQNTVQVYLRRSTGETLKPLSPPTVTFALPDQDIGPLKTTITPTGPGQYEGTVTLPTAGDWQVRITVRTSKYESPSADLTVRIY